MPIRVAEEDASHYHNKATYAHKTHVLGKSHLSAFSPRGYDEFSRGRHRCREELGLARFSGETNSREVPGWGGVQRHQPENLTALEALTLVLREVVST